jgi:hypothetical protein
MRLAPTLLGDFRDGNRKRSDALGNLFDSSCAPSNLPSAIGRGLAEIGFCPRELQRQLLDLLCSWDTRPPVNINVLIVLCVAGNQERIGPSPLKN